MKNCWFIILVIFCSVNLFSQSSEPPSIGDGTENSPYQIATLGNLYWLSQNVTEWNKHYIQTEDIDASATVGWDNGKGWTPIGTYTGEDDLNQFSGSYDGQGHTIDGLFINRPDEDYQGLFGHTFGSYIANLGVINVNIAGNEWVGALAGVNYCFSEVENCYSTGNVSGYEGIGGLIGSNTISIVSNSYNLATVTGTGYCTGGLIGMNLTSTVSNSFNAGNVTGEDTVGGLVGANTYSTVNDSYNTGNVNGDWAVAGLTGFDLESEINNSYSIGYVTGVSDAGGLIGETWNSTFNNSYWNIETSGQNSSAGGLGRTTAEMTYPYATNTYAGWDFVNIWSEDVNHDNNNGYPFLQETTVNIAEDLMPVYEKIEITNYPNPFNPETTIQFSLPYPGRVKLVVYNIKGQQVKMILNEYKDAGEYLVGWNGTDDNGGIVPSGVYFYNISIDKEVFSGKMLLLK